MQAAGRQRFIPVVFPQGRYSQLNLIVTKLPFEGACRMVVVDVGDILLKADGKTVNNAQAFSDIIAGKNIGDKITVNYKDRAGEHQTTITLEENPTLEIVTFENAGKMLTKEQEAFRANWLSSKVK